jgi:FlaA1/EpsC-like NDP-sugar epimerase
VIEFFYIVGALLAGALLAAGAQRVQGGPGPSSTRAFFFVFSGFAVPLLCGVRAFPRLVMDCASTVRSEHESLQGVASRRTLVYGAGQSCTLYLRARTLQSLEKDPEQRHFIGVVDDDTNLHGRYVHGLKVLGPPRMLPDLVAEHRVQDLVLTRPAAEPVRQIIREIRARREDVRVMEWRMEIGDWNDTDPAGG